MRVDVRVPHVRRIDRLGAVTLQAQVRQYQGERDQYQASAPQSRGRPHGRSDGHARQQDNAEVRRQRAPGRLVRNCGIEDADEDGVQREKAQKPYVRRPQPLAQQRQQHPDRAQYQNVKLAPPRSGATLRIRQQIDVVKPRLVVDSRASRALDIMRVGQDAVQRTPPMREEGREQCHRDHNRDGNPDDDMAPPEVIPERFPRLVPTIPPEEHDGEGQRQRGVSQHRRFLRGVHETQRGGEPHGPAQVRSQGVPPSAHDGRQGEKHQ